MPWQPKWPNVPWGAPQLALPVCEGKDCPALICAGVSSPGALCVRLSITVQEGHKTIREFHEFLQSIRSLH